MENISVIVMLLFGIAFLGVLSNKYKFPFPVALVLCGITISLHAIGLVLFTTFALAIAAHSLIQGISWPLAFLIGAIVSPPDAVAATVVTKGLGLHPRLIAKLEGESLVNDASGLIAYKYALTAISAGYFILWQASLNFLWMASAGIGIGLITGYLMYLIHNKFVCDPIVEVTLTFLWPFASYLLAEHFHFSGVLAVVSTGLYLSFRSREILTHQSRIMATSVWQNKCDSQCHFS